MSQSHVFFLYIDTLLDGKNWSEGNQLTLVSKELAHRINTILRLREGEAVQLFSKSIALTITLTTSPRPKDTICGIIGTTEPVSTPNKTVIVAIGLLKKESFEEAVHHATVTGATHIQPLITAKSRKSWLNEREVDRLQGVIIAACEQSKNRHIPVLLEPKKVAALKEVPDSMNIGFESSSTQGVPALITRITKEKPQNINLFIGPEGGFTTEELTILTALKTNFYTLTPTILRSQEAVCVVTGLIRSLI